ncbi:MAG: undecaprenyl-diphosphate phosphatase [Pseudomonadota bacterium]
MTWLEIIVLAIVQGMTEFLPISSSGHLILVPALAGWSDQGIAFDVAVHVGTLAAVVWFFRDDIARMVQAFIGQWRAERTALEVQDARLAWYLILATIPVGLVGLLARDLVEAYLRSPLIIAVTTAGFGVLLFLADRYGSKLRTLSEMHRRDAFLVGCAQVMALIPGTSRSGITMTMAMTLGLTPQAAARFSFLMSIPVITLAGTVMVLKLLGSPGAVDWRALIVGTMLSGIVAYLTITFFLRIIAGIGMLPFMIYRLLLAAVIVIVLV